MDTTLAPIQHAADGISVFDEAGFARFGQQAKQLGFDEVIVRRWDPEVFIDTHTHSFKSKPWLWKAACCSVLAVQHASLMQGANSRLILIPRMPSAMALRALFIGLQDVISGLELTSLGP